MDATRFDVWRLARKGKRTRPGPPVVSDENGIRFVELADVVVRARLVGNPASERVVVICPDPPNVIEHYDELIALLAPYVRVLCFELPGFGFSYPKEEFEFDVETFARSVIELLVDKLGVKRATLAFPCLTSFVALAVARKRPDLVERLVLAQAPGHGDACAWMKRVDKMGLGVSWVGQLATFLAPKTIAKMWYRAAVGPDQDLERLTWPAMEAFRLGASFSLASAFQAFKKVDGRKLQGGKVPGVVVWGEADATHRPTDRSSMQTHLGQVQVVRFFGNGHFPDLESPLRFAQGILGFEIDPELAARVAVFVNAQHEARKRPVAKGPAKAPQTAPPPAAPTPPPVPAPAAKPNDSFVLLATEPAAPAPRPSTSQRPLTPPPTAAQPPSQRPLTPPPSQRPLTPPPGASPSWTAATPSPPPSMPLPPAWQTPSAPPLAGTLVHGESSAPYDPESAAGFDPLPPKPRASASPPVTTASSPLPAWPAAQIESTIASLDPLSIEPIDPIEPVEPDSLELDAPRQPRRPTPSRVTRPSGSKPSAAPRPRARASRGGRFFALHAMLFVMVDIAAVSALALLARGTGAGDLLAAFLPTGEKTAAALLARPGVPLALATAVLAPIAVLLVARLEGLGRYVLAMLAIVLVVAGAVALATIAGCPTLSMDVCRPETVTRLGALLNGRALGLLVGGGAALGVTHAVLGPRSLR